MSHKLIILRSKTERVNEKHSSWVSQGILVNNFFIVQWNISVNIHEYQSIQAILTHSASPGILNKFQCRVGSLYTGTGTMFSKHKIWKMLGNIFCDVDSRVSFKFWGIFSAKFHFLLQSLTSCAKEEGEGRSWI